MSYSQNGEDLVVKKYFERNPSAFRLLDIGANDGITFSNSRLLIQAWWAGFLIEPSPAAFCRLKDLYKEDKTINCIQAAIAGEDGEMCLMDSGTHLDKGDTALLSTLDTASYTKWKGAASFKPVTVNTFSWAGFCEAHPGAARADFVSIDAEGMDLTILMQMDLTSMGCQCLCIEWNSDKNTLAMIRSYAAKHGLVKELLLNGENIILAR